MSDQGDSITALSLMKTDFRSIASDRPLAEGMDLLLDFDEKHPPTPVIVIHPDGTFAGLLTPLAVFRALARKLRLDEIPSLSEADLLAAMDGQLTMPVAEAMIRDVPRAYPGDRLWALMKLSTDDRLEFTPVLEDDRVTGILYATDIFHAAASLAITHDTEGIRLPEEKEDELSH